MNVSQVNVYPYQGGTVYEYLEKHFSAMNISTFLKISSGYNQECVQPYLGR